MLARHIHPLQAVSFGFVVGAVLLAPIVLLSGPAETGVTLGAATTLQLLSVLVYLGAVPTALAYICCFYGMQLSRTATSGLAATLVEPAVAVLLAAGLLGEHLSPTAWLGVACLSVATVVLGLEGSGPRRSSAGNPVFAPAAQAARAKGWHWHLRLNRMSTAALRSPAPPHPVVADSGEFVHSDEFVLDYEGSITARGALVNALTSRAPQAPSTPRKDGYDVTSTARPAQPGPLPAVADVLHLP